MSMTLPLSAMLMPTMAQPSLSKWSRALPAFTTRSLNVLVKRLVIVFNPAVGLYDVDSLSKLETI